MPAAMTVDETYNLMLFVIKKNQQGDLPPDSFNNIINVAQFSYLNYLLGEFQKYQPGRPIAPVEFGMNAQLRQRLMPFIQPPTTLSIDSLGLTPFPPDYEMWDAMYWGIYKQRVKFIQQDRLDMHLNSRLNPVTRNPVFMSIYNGFQLYPTSIGQTQLSYIRTPPTIKWGYTEDIYRRPIYEPSLSTNPSWVREDMLQIIVRALSLLGVNLSAPQVEQYSQIVKNQGQ